jgi:hypothetical protein
MDQNTIVLYLHMKWMELRHVKENLMGYRDENLFECLVRIQIILTVIPGET